MACSLPHILSTKTTSRSSIEQRCSRFWPQISFRIDHCSAKLSASAKGQRDDVCDRENHTASGSSFVTRDQNRTETGVGQKRGPANLIRVELFACFAYPLQSVDKALDAKLPYRSKLLWLAVACPHPRPAIYDHSSNRPVIVAWLLPTLWSKKHLQSCQNLALIFR